MRRNASAAILLRCWPLFTLANASPPPRIELVRKIVSISSGRLEFIPPMMPTSVAKPPQGDRWSHEVKFDGYRSQIAFDAGRARIFTRRGLDWTSKYRDLSRQPPRRELNTATQATHVWWRQSASIEIKPRRGGDRPSRYAGETRHRSAPIRSEASSAAASPWQTGATRPSACAACRPASSHRM